MQTILIGSKAERRASRFLRRQGLTKITHNYRCRMGEIDLIMRDGNSIIFVEVRYRKSSSHGHSQETVTYTKQQKIIRTAMNFLQRHPRYQRMNGRFDVIGMDATGKITWIKNAFTVQY